MLSRSGSPSPRSSYEPQCNDKRNNKRNNTPLVFVPMFSVWLYNSRAIYGLGKSPERSSRFAERCLRQRFEKLGWNRHMGCRLNAQTKRLCSVACQDVGKLQTQSEIKCHKRNETPDFESQRADSDVNVSKFKLLDAFQDQRNRCDSNKNSCVSFCSQDTRVHTPFKWNNLLEEIYMR